MDIFMYIHIIPIIINGHLLIERDLRFQRSETG